MAYEVRTISVFERQAKRLLRKYPSLRSELAILGEQLGENPEMGTPIGRNCFKIRIAIASKGKGKSGGARVITNFIVTMGAVYLINIYDKSERDTLSEKELAELLSLIPA